jgi:sugar phosphate isomerase/epimerase
MKLGRDFTNLLYSNYLNDEDRKKLLSGELGVADVDAMVQPKAKGDISGQVEVAKEWGLDHVELDGAVPNPYLEFSEDQKREAREAADSSGITLSFHLPYTYVAASMCAPYEQDRRAAEELQKRYVKFAAEIGCKYCNTHPGVVPFYHATGKYFEKVRANLIKTLVELGRLASDNGIAFHLENNTAFDSVFVEPEDLISLVRDVRQQGVDIYFNFDIGHWFTRADAGKDIPNPPEAVMDKIPGELVKELHLNDYIPGKKIFHPPLHEQSGQLKRENLERYAEMVKRMGAELIVVETAFRTKEQVEHRDEIVREETEYLRSLFG